MNRHLHIDITTDSGGQVKALPPVIVSVCDAANTPVFPIRLFNQMFMKLKKLIGLISKFIYVLVKSLQRLMAIMFQQKCNRIIFLDFDGVLATDMYYDKLIASNRKTQDHWGRLFDPECRNRLSEIIKRTNAEIIVTSSWRNYLSIFQLNMMWYWRNMPGTISGTVPKVSIYRGVEINGWLRRHKYITNYVIIDDMNYLQFNKDQTPHLVTTDHHSGLQDDDVIAAVDILSSPNYMEQRSSK